MVLPIHLIRCIHRLPKLASAAGPRNSRTQDRSPKIESPAQTNARALGKSTAGRRQRATRAVLTAAFSLPLLLSQAHAVQSVTLAWDANSETDLAGYRIRYGTSSGNYSSSIDIGNKLTTTVPNLLDGIRYYLAVTAYNKNGQESAPSNEVSFSNGVAISSPSIWAASATPATVDGGPDNPVELGLKFRSDVAGVVSGIRFYKAATNTGTHTGTLWSSSGAKLASATFTAESASGWQEVRFATPVAITANTTYVASYHANSGHYSVNVNAFATSGVDSAPLHALSNTAAAGNGVYAYGATSAFPTSTWNATNYWVDVLFQTAATAPAFAITNSSLPAAKTGTAYSATLSATGGTAPLNWSLASGTLPSGLKLTATTGVISGTPTAAGTYPFSVKVSDTSSPVKSATKNFSLTVSATTVASVSLWPGSVIPGVIDGGPDASVELGMRFKSDVAANVTAIRFYKAATNTGTHVGSLWSSTGTLLGRATFSAESASGWQKVTLSTPVAIAANTYYVVSYHTAVGHYSADQNYFASAGIDNPPLHAPANGASGPNGVYIYGSTSAFPNQVWNATNYWVDVVLSPY